MTEAMAVYGMVFAKLAIGLLAIILQINLMRSEEHTSELQSQ